MKLTYNFAPFVFSGLAREGGTEMTGEPFEQGDITHTEEIING
ncbi:MULTISPECIES: hypothetical protein [Photorhabdus]|nr:hypothetical protein [Photorhabdus thracensis]